jgi:hypothetical protein
MKKGATDFTDATDNNKSGLSGKSVAVFVLLHRLEFSEQARWTRRRIATKIAKIAEKEPSLRIVHASELFGVFAALFVAAASIRSKL